MTKTMTQHGVVLGLTLISVAVLADGFSSPAAARGRDKCANGTEVVFVDDTYLTFDSRWICSVFEGDHGTAILLGAHKKACLIKYWGWCKGPSDTGWARLETFRAYSRRR